MDIWVDFAASLHEARGEIIEINRSVHQGDAQREATGKAVVILSGSRIRGRSRRIPWRNHNVSVSGSLDFARDDRSAQRNCPIGNFNFTSAQKLPRFDYRYASIGNTSKIEQHLVGFECQWDHSFGRLDMVGKPNRCCHAGGCLFPDTLGEYRSAVSAFGKNDTAREARHTCANDRDVSVHFQMVGTDRRAVPKIFSDAS